MKNRDRYITKVCEYDMLMDMQKNIQKCYSCCILDVITGKMRNCPEEMKSKDGQESRLAVCSKCIQAWLNKEE